MEIYIARGEERNGPYSEDSIRQYVADGMLDGTELAWHEGLDEWVSVTELLEDAAPAEMHEAVDQEKLKIFISYRREDSEDVTGRIYDRLTQKFSPETIFKDVDNMPIGVDFRKHLDQQVAGCRVLLVIIGRQWAENPRLQDEADFVRIEIEYGLEPERDILMVPVLVGNASMPSTDQLPPSLIDFAYRNAIQVRPDPDFHKDMDKLMRNLEGSMDIPTEDEQLAVIKAAEQGDSDAQYNLGVMYYYGKGVEKDAKEAGKWFRKAAEQEHARGQINLGWMYHHGKGVEKDAKEAVMWYRKAAEQGHAKAQYALGKMYRNGEGVLENFKEAVMWYRKAAEQGEGLAQGHLGVMLRDGKGVNQDEEEAVKWLRKAAEQGFAGAQLVLGLMYTKGKGVLKDYVTAYAWANISASNNHTKAKKQKLILTKKMTPGQIAKAQELSKKMVKKNPKLLKK